MRRLIIDRFSDSIAVKERIINNDLILKQVEQLAKEMVCVIKTGGKIVLCGNGGSASDALHFAGEIVGRFQRERNSLPAIALNADVATTTAIANDYGFDRVYERQVMGLLKSEDILIGISTSGNSENVYLALKAAKENNIKTGGLLGKNGGKIASMQNSM